MDLHNEDPTMMRNGCLTLCQFKIPQDVVSTATFFFSKLFIMQLVFLALNSQFKCILFPPHSTAVQLRTTD